MLIQTIELDSLGEDELTGEIACPTCGKPWLTLTEYSADCSHPVQCPHLKFLLLPDAEAAVFCNGFSAAELAAAADPAARSLCPDLNGESVMAFLLSNRLEDELWEKVSSPAMDTLLRYSSCGTACGPVTHTVHFGALLGASLV